MRACAWAHVNGSWDNKTDLAKAWSNALVGEASWGGASKTERADVAKALNSMHWNKQLAHLSDQRTDVRYWSDSDI